MNRAARIVISKKKSNMNLIVPEANRIFNANKKGNFYHSYKSIFNILVTSVLFTMVLSFCHYAARNEALFNKNTNGT